MVQRSEVDEGREEREGILSMNLLEGIASGIRALLSHKMRTFLTMLGVMIGVAAVISMISIGDGAKTIIMQDSEKLGGATMIRFFRSRHIQKGGRWVRNDSEERFTYEDALAIEAECPSVRLAMPSIPEWRGVHVSTGAGAEAREMRSGYQGVTPSFQEGMKWSVRWGRFISDTDVDRALSVCVLGQEVVDELFDGENPVGESVKLRNERFTVIGTMEPRGRSLRYGWNLDDSVFIPLTTVQQRFTGNDYVRMLSIQAKSVDKVPQAIIEATELMKKRHRGEEFFTTRDVASGLDFVLRINKIIKILLSGVAGFSLLVGGIGIMNVMLVSVAERTHEIGLRKALGAKRRDILGQFLIEAVLLCTLGGIIGLALGIFFGVGVAWVITSFIIKSVHWPSALPLFWAVVALVFSATIGISFGLYPAIRAARLAPVEALRTE